MDIFRFILALHILGGSVGLISGTIVLILKKGDKNHKAIGSIFFWAMNLAGLCSFVLAVMHPNNFLFVVGIFTLYMNLTARSYLKFKRKDAVINFRDAIPTIGMVIAAFFFVIVGIKLISKDSFGWVLLSFAFISLRFVLADYKFFKGKSKFSNQWLLSHLQRMIGTYIASITAFLVVNINFKPAFVIWLAPTVLLVPLIIYWSRKYGKLSS
jgi:uncharacterized membrane protein